MKNSPPMRVSISKSCFRLQQEETTTPTDSSKLEEDRPERFSPHESPHSFHTEEDLDAFIFHINRRASYENEA
jgi:hypothetical protein